MNPINQFRKSVKEAYPHVTIKVREVSFQDLARASKHCLTVRGERKGELQPINDMARAAGIVPDGNIRFYP